MKNYYLLPFCLLLCFSSIIVAQEKEHFLVEIESRRPDVKSMVKAYEGKPSIPIMAKDLNGVEHSILNMKGKTVMLWFWNLDCPKCFEQIDAFNLLTKNYPENLQVLSFSDNSKSELDVFVKNRAVDFPVIPDSKTLADGPYGGDLGYPRIFILDQTGIVKWVIPEIEMRAGFDPYQFLEMLYKSLQN